MISNRLVGTGIEICGYISFTIDIFVFQVTDDLSYKSQEHSPSISSKVEVPVVGVIFGVVLLERPYTFVVYYIVMSLAAVVGGLGTSASKTEFWSIIPY